MKNLFEQSTEQTAADKGVSEDLLESDLVDLEDLGSLQSYSDDRTKTILSNMEKSTAVLESIRGKQAGAGSSTGVASGVSKHQVNQPPVGPADLPASSATVLGSTPQLRPRPPTPPMSGKVIPEPYPGAGKGVSDQFWTHWPVLVSKLDKLPLMSKSTLKTLGSLELSTDHGKVTIPPYLQLLARFAASYYGESVKCVPTDQVFKNIAACYKAIVTKRLYSEDVEVMNFGTVITSLKLAHWVKVVGMILFDEQDISTDDDLENFSRNDFEAASDMLTSLYPDASVLFSILSMLSSFGPDSIAPIEPFLLFEDDVGRYINTYCKGELKGSDMAVRITPRTASALAGFEPTKKDDNSPLEDVEGVTESGDKEVPEARNERQADQSNRRGLVIPTRSGTINLDDEHAGDKNVTRDTSKFVQALDFQEVKDRISGLELGQAELLKSFKDISDKLSYLVKKQEKTDSQLASTLGDICGSMTTLISQRSLAELKAATASLNSTFNQVSDDELSDSMDFTIGKQPDVKGKGKMSDKKPDIVTRLVKFNKSDCQALIADLKTMFNNAGQPSLARAITTEMLMDNFTRINLANNAKKFQNFL